MVVVIIFSRSLKECNCTPWDILTYDEVSYQICQNSNDKENYCFWRKMKDTKTMDENCFCLSDCSLSEYSHFDSYIPLSGNCSIGHYNEEYNGYADEDGNFISYEADWYEKLSK